MTTYPEDDDGHAMARLEKLGVDLTLPLSLEFSIAARDEASARAIEAVLREHAYEPQIVYDEGEPGEDGEIDPDDEEFGPSWTVLVPIVMIPAYDELVRIQATLDRIATPHGGRADGWGAMLESDDHAP